MTRWGDCCKNALVILEMHALAERLAEEGNPLCGEGIVAQAEHGQVLQMGRRGQQMGGIIIETIYRKSRSVRRREWGCFVR